MLGIDVSKDTLHCALLDPTTRRKIWSRVFDNTPRGVDRLLKATSAECPWALEPTGSYSTTVVKRARAAGRNVLLAEPRRAKKFLQSIQDRAKCDRLDAAGLGLFALSRDLPPYPLKSDEVEHVDQLLKARKGIALSLQQLQAQAKALPRASASLQPAIEALKAQERSIMREIKALTTPGAAGAEEATTSPGSEPNTKATTVSMACAQKLLKVPGIGPVTATTVATRLAAKSFARSDAFVSYCGLDVAIRDSGRKKGNQGLTKQGDAELRRLLYLAAQANLRMEDSPFKAHYDRERSKGLSSTAALCSIARKLARLCWSLAYYNQDYDPNRIYQHPQNMKNG